MSSQRHRIENYGASSAGAVFDEGALAPAIDKQTDTMPATSPLTVPVGPPGGPLQGSPLTGAIPPDAQPVATIPTLTNLTPASVVVNSAPILVTLDGSKFVTGAVVVYDVHGVVLSTTFVSSTQLKATFPSRPDINVTQISVRNPNGQTSQPAYFNYTMN
jgi:hypothetical protein